MKEKDKDNYSSVGTNLAAAGMTSTYAGNLDHLHYDHHHQHEQYELGHRHIDQDNNNNAGRAAHNMAAAMDDYMLSHSSCTSALALSPPPPPPPPLDRLCFADHVMQFADFGPKLALNHHHQHKSDEHQLHELEINNNNDHNMQQQDGPNNYHVNFLKFPVLQAAGGGDHMPAQDDHQHHPPPSTRDLEEEEELRQLQLIQGELGGGAYHDHDQHGTGAGSSGRAGGTHGITSILPSAAVTTQDHDVIMSNNNNNNNPAAVAAAVGGVIVNTTMVTRTTTAAADDPMISIIKNMQLQVSSTSNNSNVKKKRPRSIKTSEEVESQRMTHIAVERNRRKQMNEHLRVLRSLMPTSYVQRGDQASIIGGAIEFVRELEQLLQCLESQKRRRLYGGTTDQATAGVIAQTSRPLGGGDDDPSSSLQGGFQLQQQHDEQQHPPILMFPPPPMLPYNASGGGTTDPNMIMSNSNINNHDHQRQHHVKLVDNNNNNLDIMSASTGSCIREDMAESKSCIADVEVKMLGFDALIKVLSRRRPGQLIKLIAALEDLHFNILHTNITTIEQTVLYSFNIKVASDSGFTAEEIASSVQQIFTFIHANTNTTSM